MTGGKAVKKRNFERSSQRVAFWLFMKQSCLSGDFSGSQNRYHLFFPTFGLLQGRGFPNGPTRSILSLHRNRDRFETTFRNQILDGAMALRRNDHCSGAVVHVLATFRRQIRSLFGGIVLVVATFRGKICRLFGAVVRVVATFGNQLCVRFGAVVRVLGTYWSQVFPRFSAVVHVVATFLGPGLFTFRSGCCHSSGPYLLTFRSGCFCHMFGQGLPTLRGSNPTQQQRGCFF